MFNSVLGSFKVFLDVVQALASIVASLGMPLSGREELVQNARTKVCHLVGVGPHSGSAVAGWTALCGWAFGRQGGFTLVGATAGDIRCGRCTEFAALRAHAGPEREPRP